eukprot:TRINITY_DN27364_c0_g1_i1.p1 TRINITY_DN27364_c0_g1~~TRINITY_DN27364_c0_g1_i1.p1  ORF type:complete len:557 (+),score=101.57 TRINITY_DN27364_c0_g1_i1:131-1801(+)
MGRRSISFAVSFVSAQFTIAKTWKCGAGDPTAVRRWLPDREDVGQLLEFDASGLQFHTVASQPKINGAVLAQISNESIFTAPAACPAELQKWSSQLRASEDGQSLATGLLALCLLATCQASESRFQSLLEALPRLEDLGHLPLVQAASNRGAQTWETLGKKAAAEKIASLRRLQQVWDARDSDGFATDLVWALAVAESQAHGFGEDFALVPLVGMLRHSEQPNILLRVSKDHSRLDVLALRQIEAGDKLTISYNSPSQRAHLLQFGMFSRQHPVKLLHQGFPLPNASAAKEALGTHGESEMKEAILHGAAVTCRAGKADFSKALSYLRFAFLDDGEVAMSGGLAALGCQGASSAKETVSCPKEINLANEKKALQFLHSLLQRRARSPGAERPRGKLQQQRKDTESLLHDAAVDVVLAEWACANQALSEVEGIFMRIHLRENYHLAPVMIALLIFLWRVVFPYLSSTTSKAPHPRMKDSEIRDAHQTAKDSRDGSADSANEGPREAAVFLDALVEHGYITERYRRHILSDKELEHFFAADEPTAWHKRRKADLMKED